MITVAVIICHMLAGISDPVCHEEIVAHAEKTIADCQMESQLVVADWKENSKFKGDEWAIKKIGCFHGYYQPKDSI